MWQPDFERRKRLGLLVVLGLSALSLVAVPMLGAAEDYPFKPITLIVGYPPGGPTAIRAQIFLEVAKKYLPRPQPILIEYKPGAAQAIGADFFFKQPADGYTVLVADTGLFAKIALDGHLLHFKKDDFAFIGSMGASPGLIVVNKESPFKQFDDLLDYARKNPGKLSYGHTGIGTGSHVTGEYCFMSFGIKLNPIPFQGGAPLMAAMLGGHIDSTTGATATFGDHIKPGGGLRTLLMLSPERWPELPDVPTAMEKGYNVKRMSHAFFATPKGTPKPVLDVLREVLKKTAEDPKAKQALMKAQFLFEYMGAQETEKEANEEFEIASKVFKALGLLK